MQPNLDPKLVTAEISAPPAVWKVFYSVLGASGLTKQVIVAPPFDSAGIPRAEEQTVDQFSAEKQPLPELVEPKEEIYKPTGFQHEYRRLVVGSRQLDEPPAVGVTKADMLDIAKRDPELTDRAAAHRAGRAWTVLQDYLDSVGARHDKVVLAPIDYYVDAGDTIFNFTDIEMYVRRVEARRKNHGVAELRELLPDYAGPKTYQLLCGIVQAKRAELDKQA